MASVRWLVLATFRSEPPSPGKTVDFGTNFSSSFFFFFFLFFYAPGCPGLGGEPGSRRTNGLNRFAPRKLDSAMSIKVSMSADWPPIVS